MKNYYDGKLYLVFSAVCLAVSLFLFGVSFYSICSVEPKAASYIAAAEKNIEGRTDIDQSVVTDINGKYRKAFAVLRSPQMFALYQNFDNESYGVKKTAEYLEKVYAANGTFPVDSSVYLNALLKRRSAGSALGRNTGVFFVILSVSAFALFLYERRAKKV